MMYINAMGDLTQSQFILDGLAYLNALRHSFVFITVAEIFVFLTFVYSLKRIGIDRQGNLLYPIFFLIFAPATVSWVVHSDLPVLLGVPAAAADVESQLKIARQDVLLAQRSLSAAQQSADPGPVAEANRRVKEAAAKVRELQKLQGDAYGASAITTAPELLKSFWRISNGVSWGVWDVFKNVQGVHPAQRVWQSQVAAQLARDPALTESEKKATSQLSDCLSRKLTFLDQANKQKDMISKFFSTPEMWKAYEAGDRHGYGFTFEATSLAREHQRMMDACIQAADDVVQGVDVTPEEVQEFTHSWVVPNWVPGVGGSGLFEKTRDDQRQFLAGQMGLDPAELAGMSDEQVGAAFLRYNKLMALSKGHARDIARAASNTMASGQTANKSGVQAAASTVLAEFFGGFLAGCKEWVVLSINWCYWAAMLAFCPMVLIALLPGRHLKAPTMYLLFLLFLGSWQVTINVVSQFTARISSERMVQAAPPTGMWDGIKQIASETYRSIGGNNTAVGTATAAQTAATGGAIMKMASPSSIEAMKKLLMKGGIAGKPLPAAVLTGLAAAGLTAAQVSQQLDQGQREFQAALSEACNTAPVLSELAAGVVDVQRGAVQRVQDKADAMEAMLYLASPILTFLIFFGGYKGAGALNLGGLISGIGTQLGGMLAGRIFGIATGGGSKFRGPKAGGGGGKSGGRSDPGDMSHLPI